jgi:hypothetical protein
MNRLSAFLLFLVSVQGKLRNRNQGHDYLILGSALIGLAIAACGPSKVDERTDRPPLLKREDFLSNQAGPRNKRLGEDCSAHRLDCADAVCLRHSPKRSGWACSRACLTEAECPDDWHCARISLLPGKKRYCAPPKNFVPHPVSVRSNGRSAQ